MCACVLNIFHIEKSLRTNNTKNPRKLYIKCNNNKNQTLKREPHISSLFLIFTASFSAHFNKTFKRSHMLHIHFGTHWMKERKTSPSRLALFSTLFKKHSVSFRLLFLFLPGSMCVFNTQFTNTHTHTLDIQSSISFHPRQTISFLLNKQTKKKHRNSRRSSNTRKYT